MKLTHHELTALLGFMEAMLRQPGVKAHRIEQVIVLGKFRSLTKRWIDKREKYQVIFTEQEALAFGRLYLWFEDMADLLFCQPLHFAIGTQVYEALDREYFFKQTSLSI